MEDAIVTHKPRSREAAELTIVTHEPLLRTILSSRGNERNGCDDRDDCDARAAKNARGRFTPG